MARLQSIVVGVPLLLCVVLLLVRSSMLNDSSPVKPLSKDAPPYVGLDEALGEQGSAKEDIEGRGATEDELKEFMTGREHPPELPLAEESHAKLREWNLPYMEKRLALRKTLPSPFKLHTFYTLDCTFHSLWQVMTLEMTWSRVKQGGFISRVVSGCLDSPNPQKREQLSQSILPPEEEKYFGTFFAPTFSKLPSGEYYAPYNRPNAIWYWVNHTDLTEDVFACLDPDMAYMKRLNFDMVTKGHPASQYYVYMRSYPFERFRCPLCPQESYDKKPYEVGPPWMLHIDDLRTVLPTWVGLVPMLRKLDKGAWIIEMVAYSVAMAYHKLAHTVVYDGMVDNVEQVKVWKGDTDEMELVPALLHYCYTWEVGETPPRDQNGAAEQLRRITAREKSQQSPVIDYYHFSKYRVPTDWPGGNGRYHINFMSCEAPLMQEFHTPLALPTVAGKKFKGPRTVKFLELFLPMLNDAMTLWKKKHCANATRVNYRKLLRTAHPTHWVSAFEIEGKGSDDRGLSKKVNFKRIQ